MLVEVFLREKNALALIKLREKKEWYISLLAKEVDTTYPHMVYIVNVLESSGLVKTVKRGRKKLLQLTPLGEEVAIALENVYITLKRIEERAHTG